MGHPVVGHRDVAQMVLGVGKHQAGPSTSKDGVGGPDDLLHRVLHLHLAEPQPAELAMAEPTSCMFTAMGGLLRLDLGLPTSPSARRARASSGAWPNAGRIGRSRGRRAARPGGVPRGPAGAGFPLLLDQLEHGRVGRHLRAHVVAAGVRGDQDRRDAEAVTVVLLRAPRPAPGRSSRTAGPAPPAPRAARSRG